MTAEAVPIFKATRAQNIRILHLSRLKTYGDQLRPQLAQAMNTGTFNEAKVYDIVRRAMSRSAEDIAVTEGFTFDRNNPAVLQSAQIVTQDIKMLLTKSTPQTVAEVTRMFPPGLTAKERQRRLDDIRGLDVRSAKALERYRQTLENSPRRPAQRSIDQSVEKLRREYIRRRAVSIATFETGRMLADAREVVVQEAIATGEAKNGLKTWVAQKDACPTCQSLSGKTARIGQPFSSSKGIFHHPPVHPHCRCTYHVTVT